MNKILLIGRIAREPEIFETVSGIKYSRFSIAVDRPFGDNQTDFIPIVAWRNQAIFIENYLNKGALVSIEGRFTSSSYTNNENQNITRYEVTAERVSSLETRAQREAREKGHAKQETKSATSTQTMNLVKESKEESKENKDQKSTEENQEDVPWEIDL